MWGERQAWLACRGREGQALQSQVPSTIGEADFHEPSQTTLAPAWGHGLGLLYWFLSCWIGTTPCVPLHSVLRDPIEVTLRSPPPRLGWRPVPNCQGLYEHPFTVFTSLRCHDWLVCALQATGALSHMSTLAWTVPAPLPTTQMGHWAKEMLCAVAVACGGRGVCFAAALFLLLWMCYNSRNTQGTSVFKV